MSSNAMSTNAMSTNAPMTDPVSYGSVAATSVSPKMETSEPWYRRTLRWGQTNLVEIDPMRYDDAWWRQYWRDTKVQGLIVNAGGIVAYYPSEFPLHHRAITLGDTDLYGAVVASAREEGLTVVARMDSNRVAEDFYRAHPDWICLDRDGEPYRAAEKYITCINSPYYREYLPGVLREIIRRSQPDGFADNSWAGIPRSKICYCAHCQEQFTDASGLGLPQGVDWNSEAYRRWVSWSYGRRTDLWELNNSVTTAEGGPDCRWMGMLSGDVINNSERFIDLPAILDRSEIVMLDHQHRNLLDGFEQNAEVGKRLHELLGWDKLIPESTPQYQLGLPAFRVAAMPAAEVRLWATAGFAGGIQPWWHHIGSCHDDRRQYQTAVPLFRWHEANEDVLFDRTPLADVAVVWSQANHDFVGRNSAHDVTVAPYRGVVRALNRAGIGFLPVHADRLSGIGDRFSVLVLPEMGALSDKQVSAVEAFASAGGSVIASGRTGMFDEWGTAREDFALGDLFGVHHSGDPHGSIGGTDTDIETHRSHSYLRLLPERRKEVHGPLDSEAPEVTDTPRHPVLAGLDDTDLVGFGGYLPSVRLDPGTVTLATFVPDFPIFPPETSWMREPRTDQPAITIRSTAAGSRLVWFVADIDRCYGRDAQVDHGLLIANAVQWALGDSARVAAEADGLVMASAYVKGDLTIVHLTNMVVTSPIPGRERTIVPVGPVRLRLRRSPGEPQVDTVTLRVAKQKIPAAVEGDWLVVEIERVEDHEVIVVGD